MSLDFFTSSEHGVSPVVLPTTLKFGCWRSVGIHSQSRWHSSHRVQPIGSPVPKHAYLLKAVVRGLSEQRHWEAIDRLARRVLLHETIQHSGIAPVLDAELDRFPFFIVEPYVDGVSLIASAASMQRWRLSKTLWIARQIAEVLDAAHQKAHVHLGLTPQKILVDAEGKVTVVGWNNTHRFGQRCWLPKECVSDVCTRAPETFLHDYRAQPAADIFSFGSLLFLFFSGTWPTCGGSVDEIERQQKSLIPPDLEGCSRVCPSPFSKLVKGMLAKNPIRRPTIETVLNEIVSLEIDQLDR